MVFAFSVHAVGAKVVNSRESVYLCRAMRVLHVNTSERVGGAAIAASRLVEALNRAGVEARLLVRDRQSGSPHTVTLAPRWRLRLAFLWERLRIWVANGCSRDGLWSVDIACAGADVTRTAEFREADIIHFHWVNQGLLSMHQLECILRSGKPVVWTMHDMWPCTAICHHARDCKAFGTHCHHCPQLLRPSARDLSWQLFEAKRRAYAKGAITFVGCSRWMAGEARKSALLEGHGVASIPNTCDSNIFHPGVQADARRRLGLPGGKLMLFACQKVTNVRKGLAELLRALQEPALRPWRGQLTLVVVGEMAGSVARDIPFPVHVAGYVSSEADMAALYQGVDVFVTPSWEENLPNTIMEAMACGTPCVGFSVGGIPEMIDHRVNGYVARYRDVADLAEGIAYVLGDAAHSLSCAAAGKAAATWNEDAVVQQYMQLYDSLLTQQHTAS